MSWLDPLAAAVLRASLEGAAAVALVWLVCRAAPRLPASVRCFLWWAACVRFVVALPGWGVATLPLLPADWPDAAGGAAAVEGLAGPSGAAAGEAARPAGVRSTEPTMLRAPSASVPAPAAASGGAAPVGPRIGSENAEAADPTRRAPLATGGVASGSSRASIPPHRGDTGGLAGSAVRNGSLGSAEGAGVAALQAFTLLWLVGLAGALIGVARGIARLRGVLRTAQPVPAGRLTTILRGLSHRLGLQAPALLASPGVASPLLVGPARPRVVLPAAGLAAMARDEAEMVLCHELAHLRRRDLWLGWLPALARTIFFFHPLAALAAREYLLAREAACDAEVLRVLGSAPRDYGRLLLRWGVAPRETGLAAAAAASSRHHLKRRLLMLDHHHHAPRRHALLWAAPAAVALLALVPLRLVASEGEAAMIDPSLLAALPGVPAWVGEPAPAPPAAPEAPGAPAAPTAATPAAPAAHALSPAAPHASPEAHPAPAAPARPASAPRPSGAAGAPAPRAGIRPLPGVAAPPAPPPAAGGAGAAAPASPVALPAPSARLAPPAAPRPAPVAAPEPRPAPPALRQPTPLPAATAVAPTPPTPPARDRGARATGTAPRTVSSRPAAPAARQARAASARGDSEAPSPRSSVSYSFGGSGDRAWVYLDGEARTTFSSGHGDVEAAERARRGDEPLLYVRQGGNAWVIRDPALLAEAKRILDPVMELGRRQGELGREQGALGRQQGDLGRQQGALGREQGELGREQGRLSGEIGRLAGELATLGSHERDATAEERQALARRRGEIEARIADLEERIHALGAQQRELGERQRELGDEQRGLGDEQGALGDRQSELGRRQSAASEAAEEGLADLVARAREAGKADAVR